MVAVEEDGRIFLAVEEDVNRCLILVAGTVRTRLVAEDRHPVEILTETAMVGEELGQYKICVQIVGDECWGWEKCSNRWVGLGSVDFGKFVFGPLEKRRVNKVFIVCSESNFST